MLTSVLSNKEKDLLQKQGVSRDRLPWLCNDKASASGAGVHGFDHRPGYTYCAGASAPVHLLVVEKLSLVQ